MAAYNNGERASEKAERGECANGWMEGRKRERVGDEKGGRKEG